MFTLQTPNLDAGRYCSGSTPLAPSLSLPPAALMRATSSCGTEDEPCITSGTPGMAA